MTSESFGCHDISRHRLRVCLPDGRAAVSACRSRLTRSLWWLPASSGCTARGWGATGGGLGVLVVGGAFVQYAQPLASGSRPSWSRATWAGSRAGPESHHGRRDPAQTAGRGRWGRTCDGGTGLLTSVTPRGLGGEAGRPHPWAGPTFPGGPRARRACAQDPPESAAPGWSRDSRPDGSSSRQDPLWLRSGPGGFR